MACPHHTAPMPGCCAPALNEGKILADAMGAAYADPEWQREFMGVVRSCEKHGPSAMGLHLRGPSGPSAYCVHCEADAAEGQDRLIHDMVTDAEDALCDLVTFRLEGDVEAGKLAARRFGNVLRDLVKEARRR